MPHTEQAKKSLRQDKIKALRNKTMKNAIKSLVKDSREAIEAKAEGAEQLIKDAIKKIDKAVQKGVLKKNTGSRKKSRLMKKFNKSKKEVAK